MIKYCKGCGVRLQDNNVLLEGYTNDISKDLCKRCFRLKNYGEYEVVTKSNDEYIKIIEDVGKTKSLVLYVVDLISLPNHLESIKQYLKNNKVILVLNKKDMLPLSVTDKKILDYIDSNFEDVFIDKIIISANKNYNLDRLMRLIKKYRVYKNVYVVGNTNAGKSTLINKLIENYSIDKSLITISSMPSTTLDEIKIPFKDFYLIDTPGLVDRHSIINYIDNSDIKKLSSKKEIKPKTYQIKRGQALVFENFLRIDYIEGERNSFTVFASNNISVKRINGKRHNTLHDLCRKEIDLKFHEDIVINGFGFVKTVMEGKVYVYVDKDVEVFTRKSMI